MNKNILIPIVTIALSTFAMGQGAAQDINGAVWAEEDNNNIFNSGERPLGNYGVTLYLDECGQCVANTTKTDALGKYTFSNLEDGTYCIEFDNIPNNYTLNTERIVESEDNLVIRDIHIEAPGSGSPDIQNQDMSLKPKQIIVVDNDTEEFDSGHETTVNVLQNDDGQINPDTLCLVSNDDATSVNNGTKSIDEVVKLQTLVIENEGVWVVTTDKELTFTPESGFEGDPTAVNYQIQSEDGSSIKIGQVDLFANCDCSNYEEKSVGLPTLLYLFFYVMMLSPILITNKNNK